jgi:hypothetical protein
MLFVENNQSLTLGAKAFDNTFKIMINAVEPKHYSFGLGIISEYLISFVPGLKYSSKVAKILYLNQYVERHLDSFCSRIFKITLQIYLKTVSFQIVYMT